MVNEQSSEIAERGIDYVSNYHKPEDIYKQIDYYIEKVNIRVGNLEQWTKPTVSYVASQRKFFSSILRKKII